MPGSGTPTFDVALGVSRSRTPPTYGDFDAEGINRSPSGWRLGLESLPGDGFPFLCVLRDG